MNKSLYIHRLDRCFLMIDRQTMCVSILRKYNESNNLSVSAADPMCSIISFLKSAEK